jgi:hypothetical protein
MMTEKDLKVFELHANNEQKITITNKDGIENTFQFKPLPTQHMGKLMYVMERLSDFKNMDVENPDALLEMMSKNEKSFGIIEDLIVIMIRDSYKNLDDDLARRFARSNFLVLLRVLFDMNSEQGSDEKMKNSVQDFIDKKKKLIETADANQHKTPETKV